MAASGLMGRRAFLSTSAGALALAATAVGVGLAPSAGATAPTAWVLMTTWTTPRGSRGRLSCRCGACRAHAANKIYASSAAATAGRAHHRCLCLPVQYPLAADTYQALFATTDQVDRRDPVVADLLAGSSLPAPLSGSGSTAGSTPAPTPASGRSGLAQSARPINAGAVAAEVTSGSTAQPPAASASPAQSEHSTQIVPPLAPAPSPRAPEVKHAASGRTSTTAALPGAEWIPLPVIAAALVVGGLIRLRNRGTEPAPRE